MMRVLFWVIAVLLAMASFYIIVGRPWLKRQAWAAPFFDFIEPLEIRLWQKSETLLAARLLSWGAGMVAIYDAVSVFAAPLIGLDWTPVTAQLLIHIQPEMRPIVVTSAFSLLGALIEWLRRCTTKPLELVAVPEAQPLPGPVQEAVFRAEALKDVAVEAVKEAKAEGTV